MKTNLLLPLVVLGFASLLVTGGCANEDQLRKSQELLKAQELKNQKLEADAKTQKEIVDSKDRTISAMEQRIASLQTINQGLKKNCDDLKTKNDRLTAAGSAKGSGSKGPDVAAKDKQIASLKSSNDKTYKNYIDLKSKFDKLQKSYNDLKARYDKLVAKKPPKKGKK